MPLCRRKTRRAYADRETGEPRSRGAACPQGARDRPSAIIRALRRGACLPRCGKPAQPANAFRLPHLHSRRLTANPFRFFHRVASRMRDIDLARTAGSLSFTTLLAIVPLVTVAFSFVARFPVFEDWLRA